MAGLQILTPAEIGSLSTELDIFSGGRAPRPDLIEKNLYPPLPICSHTLIWGFPILRSAERRRLRQVNCLVIPACPPIEMLSLALKLENRAGSFSWPEKERMWQYLAASEAASEDLSTSPTLTDLFSDLSPLIEGHPDPQLAAKTAAFAALPQGLKTLVAEGQVDLKSADRVRSLPEEVFAGLQAGGLTFSQRRQFLNELFEVSRRGELTQEEIRGVADQAFRDKNPIDTVRRQRFPTLSALDRRFSVLEEQLLRGSGVKVKPPPYFEGDNLTVEFQFDSAESFNRKLNALHSLEGHLDALLELLH
jgi:hypothetical protein